MRANVESLDEFRAEFFKAPKGNLLLESTRTCLVKLAFVEKKCLRHEMT